MERRNTKIKGHFQRMQTLPNRKKQTANLAASNTEYMKRSSDNTKDVFHINYNSQITCITQCVVPKQVILNLYTKRYLVGPSRLSPLRFLIFIKDVIQASSFHTNIQFLLMTLTLICPILVSVFSKQQSSLNYVKLTTG